MRYTTTIVAACIGIAICLFNYTGYDPHNMFFFMLSLPAWFVDLFVDVHQVSVLLMYVLTIVTWGLLGFIADVLIARFIGKRSLSAPFPFPIGFLLSSLYYKFGFHRRMALTAWNRAINLIFARLGKFQIRLRVVIVEHYLQIVNVNAVNTALIGKLQSYLISDLRRVNLLIKYKIVGRNYFHQRHAFRQRSGFVNRLRRQSECKQINAQQ
jgi:hypothetical protein